MVYVVTKLRAVHSVCNIVPRYGIVIRQHISCTACVGVKSQNLEDAQMVLLSLGYNKAEVSGAISRVLASVTSEPSAEEILKESLKVLSI